MTQDEIIEMAIEAEFVSHGKPSDEESELFVCLDKDIYKFAKLVADKAIAELEIQEPWCMKMNGCKTKCEDCPEKVPQRTWVGLTLDEIALLHANYPNPQGFALALQAKLKEKNT
jgi:hypothetical protein